MRPRHDVALVFTACCALLLPACELTEVTTAEASDEVLAELVLHAGESRQALWMYRTAGLTPEVEGAIATLKDEATGTEYVFERWVETLCIEPGRSGDPRGTCYAANMDARAIRPGGRYSLRITLPDGRAMTGVTTVPGAFRSLTPAVDTTKPERSLATSYQCALAPGTPLEMMWSQSKGTSVYLIEVRMPGLRDALRAAGDTTVFGNASVDLLGLAISAADTTITFPTEMGLFDRFDDSLLPVLLAVSNGLPPNVDADVLIAAADRNYVNWVRGGSFNPSGTVRASSIQGDGRGVFGSVVTVEYSMTTATSPDLPRCQ